MTLAPDVSDKDKSSVDVALHKEDDEVWELLTDEWDNNCEDDNNICEDKWDGNDVEDDVSNQLWSELANYGIKMEN